MTSAPRGERRQVYIAARHADWWDTLPRYERSKIVAEALDMWRAAQRSRADSRAADAPERDTPQQDA